MGADAGNDDRPGLIEAEAIRATVLECAGVAAVSSGPFGEVASYFSGRRVPGVRVDDERVEVHVVARADRPLPVLAEDLAVRLTHLSGGRRLQVVVSDVVLGDESLDGDTA